MTTYEQFNQQFKEDRNYSLPERRLFNSGRVMFFVFLILTTLMVIFASSRG